MTASTLQALAAGLMFSLLSVTAQAATVSYGVDLEVAPSVYVTGDIDTNGTNGVISASDITGYHITFGSAVLDSVSSTLTVSGDDLVAHGNELSFTFSGNNTDFQIHKYGGSNDGILDFNGFARYLYVTDFSGIRVLQPETVGSTIVVGTSSVSVVPLPTSIGLFATALVALGAVGHGLKRDKTTAVA